MYKKSKNWFHFYEKHKSDAVSVCQHVLEGEKANFFGRAKSCFIAACCKDCITGPERSMIILKHIFDHWPEYVSLAHLPIYGLAQEQEGRWMLSRLDIDPDPVQVGGYLNLSTTGLELMEEKFFYQTVVGFPTSVAFSSGVRVLPVWSTREYAPEPAEYLIHGKTVEFKLDFTTLMEITEKGFLDHQNYICIHRGDLLWEYIVVNNVLDLERNTLIKGV